jgi:hypothetical protein
MGANVAAAGGGRLVLGCDSHAVGVCAVARVRSGQLRDGFVWCNVAALLTRVSVRHADRHRQPTAVLPRCRKFQSSVFWWHTVGCNA